MGGCNRRKDAKGDIVEEEREIDRERGRYIKRERQRERRGDGEER